jgi:hypothetical protein
VTQGQYRAKAKAIEVKTDKKTQEAASIGEGLYRPKEDLP